MRALLSALLVLAVAGCDAGAPAADAVAVRLLVDGQADVTYAADGATRTAQADGAWETRLSAARGTALTLTAVSRNGAPVTAVIEVDGRVVASDRGLSAHSSARSGDDDDDDSTDGQSGEIEVHGAVEAAGADRLTVRGLVFVITPSTRLFDGDNQPVPFGTFAVGTFVEAEGYPQADGTVRADKIKLDDNDGDEHETEVEGTIDAIDAASITIAGTTFTTDAATRYLTDDGDPTSRSAFTVGARAEAEGWTRDGALYAEKVKLDDD